MTRTLTPFPTKPTARALSVAVAASPRRWRWTPTWRCCTAAGSVLDPVAAIRCRISLEPGQSVTLDQVHGIGASRDAVLGMVEKYRDRRLADRVFELAWNHAQVVLRQINAREVDAQLLRPPGQLILYANPALRAESSVLVQNQRGQSGLWGYAISGDLPIVLLRVGGLANIELVRQLIQAHAYWRLKGLVVTW